MTATALGVGLGAASIFLGGHLGVTLLLIGSAIFLPASIYLAKQVSGRPIVEKSPPQYVKPRPILNAAFVVAWGLFYLLQFLMAKKPDADSPLFHTLTGVASVLFIAFGGVKLVTAVVERIKMGPEGRG